MKYQSVIEIRVTLIQGELFFESSGYEIDAGDEQVFRGISFRIKVKMIFVKSYWKERVFGYLATSMYLRKEKLPL